MAHRYEQLTVLAGEQSFLLAQLVARFPVGLDGPNDRPSRAKLAHYASRHRDLVRFLQVLPQVVRIRERQAFLSRNDCASRRSVSPSIFKTPADAGPRTSAALTCVISYPGP